MSIPYMDSIVWIQGVQDFDDQEKLEDDWAPLRPYDCPDCKGTKVYTGLHVQEPCKTCEG